MTLKHKLANRPSWSRVLEKKYTCTRVDMDDFHGYVTRLDIIKVKKPLYVLMHRKKLKIADDHYRWFMLFPDEDHYSLTVMMDENDEIVQCYFDIVVKNELNEDGIPGFDDLYLDVVFTKDDNILLDEEDLSAALRKGDVSPDTADLAYFSALEIQRKVEGHYAQLVEWIFRCIKNAL